MRILIVDDSKTMRAFLSRMMHDLHHDVNECPNGSAAVERYRELWPDLVLMDIRMPVMDGIEATERIRSLDAQANVVIVTEVNDNKYRDAAAQAGAIRYFLKDDLLPLLSFITVNA
jgi:CheY-like chemotaxis protein